MMYLYNGHRAPALPVYDPGELPYGLIVAANADNTALILMLCVNRPYYGTNPEDSTKTGVYNTGRMLVYTCTDTEDAWTFSMETENPLTANDDDPGGGVLWTLDDILKTDGSVWMAGTQPVPERVSEAWVRSFQEGLALGLVGAPLPYTGTAEPVAYLYNGIPLPVLPEWDKGSEPYAVIFRNGQKDYGFWTGASPITITDSGKVSALTAEYRTATRWQWSEKSRPLSATNAPLWANYDVYASDGKTLLLAASDPLPLYTYPVFSDWLYNAEFGPKPPEWDDVNYPYAFMSIGRLFVTKYLPYFNTQQNYMAWEAGDGVHALVYLADGMRTEWRSPVSIDSMLNLAEGLATWANFDVYGDDGKLYLAASEPIPAHE